MDRSDPLWPYFAQTTDRALECYHEPGPWLTGAVTSGIAWPMVNQVLYFQGREFLLLPSTEQWFPALCVNMRVNGISTVEAGRTALSRFASALAWHEQAGLSIDSFTFDRESPVHRSRRRVDLITEHLNVGLQELETVTDPKNVRGLALYREGLSTTSHFYAALNFYKVVENFVPGKDREAWFNKVAPEVVVPRVKERLEGIQCEHGKSIGAYFMEEGRREVAHAREEKAVDPDDAQTRFRFASDYEVFQAFARIAIEEFVKTPHNRSRSGPPANQIQGFLKAQDPQVLRWLRYKDEPVRDAKLVIPSPVTLVATRGGQTIALTGMEIDALKPSPDGLWIEIETKHAAGRVGLQINLRNQKLEPHIELVRFYQPTEQSSRETLEEMALLIAFNDVVMRNGCVRLIDEESNVVWGYSDAFIPVNAFYQPSGFASLASEIGALIARLDLQR